MLNDVPWSKWQLAVTPTLPEGTESNLWEKRRGDLTGFRRKEICDGQYHRNEQWNICTGYIEHCVHILYVNKHQIGQNLMTNSR